MGSVVSRVKKTIKNKKVFLHKKKNCVKKKNPHITKFKVNKSVVSVKFIPYDGKPYNKKIHYSYTYKGVPGGFYL